MSGKRIGTQGPNYHWPAGKESARECRRSEKEKDQDVFWCEQPMRQRNFISDHMHRKEAWCKSEQGQWGLGNGI